MRKKELLKLNSELFEKSQKYMALYEELKQENAELLSEIERLRKENSELTEKSERPTPLEKLDNKLKNQAKLSEEAKFGASAIGKIVVKAASCCNTLTSCNDGYDPKELVNLILGRTEVAKAEILKAVEADMSVEGKISLIETVRQSADDYFDSVMAQKD